MDIQKCSDLFIMREIRKEREATRPQAVAFTRCDTRTIPGWMLGLVGGLVRRYENFAECFVDCPELGSDEL